MTFRLNIQNKNHEKCPLMHGESIMLSYFEALQGTQDTLQLIQKNSIQLHTTDCSHI